jgi:LPS-assembly protein
VRPALSPLILILVMPALQAAGDWSLCRTPQVSPALSPAADPALITIDAGRLFSLDGRVLEFSNEVRLRQGRESIDAWSLRLDRKQETIKADGPLVYSDGGLRFEAESLLLQRRQRSGELLDIRFTLAESHLRGTAERVRLDGEQVSRFERVRYTTCDPDREAWSLSASRLKLDRESGRGTATHSVLRLGGVPVLYLPWIQFPIDDRRLSGLLTPTLGQSEADGWSLSLPFYWNIAPNHDMTITPSEYSDRGSKLDTENRYLFANHQGRIELATLDDELSGEHRWLERWRHESRFAGDIRVDLLYQKVSDSDYLEDFEPATNGNPVDWLKSAAEISAEPGGWQARLLFDRYQALNLTKPLNERPYERWPQLSLDRLFTGNGNGWSLDWKNQWTRFRHDSNTEGERLLITPRLSYRLESSAGHVEPALRLDHAEYRLDQPINGKTELTRNAPVASIDSGLVFERLTGSTRNWRQTLEPRLFLLYAPYRNQDDLPDFDSSLLPENLDNLFAENRFSGGDRVGDAQQISLSATTRLFDETDREVLSLTLGRAYWLDDRRVSLDGSTDRRDASPLMGRLRYSPKPAWTLDLALVRDLDDNELIQGDIALRHQSAGRALNLEYHLRRDKLEQSTLSLVYPLSPALQLFAKRQYSVRQQKPVENLLGLAWQSCCWGMKLLYRESSDRDFTEIDRGVFLELTLKGLGSAGKSIDSIAESAILGYHPAF